MPTAILLAPTAGASYLTRLGNNYVADEYGVIRDVPLGTESQDLQSSGCALVSPGRFPLFMLRADMNSVEDQVFSPSLIGAVNWFMPEKFVALNASVALSAAAGGVYTQRDKGGVQIATLAFSALTGADPKECVITPVAPVAPAGVMSGVFYLALDTPQGEPATCDIYVYGDLISN